MPARARSEIEFLTTRNTTVLKSVLHRPEMATSRLTSIAAMRGDSLYIRIALDSADLPLIAALSDFSRSNSFLACPATAKIDFPAACAKSGDGAAFPSVSASS